METKPAQTQPEAELTFTFKVSVINLILAALDELPHKYSRKVIDDIQAQAQAQVARQPAPVPEVE